MHVPKLEHVLREVVESPSLLMFRAHLLHPEEGLHLRTPRGPFKPELSCDVEECLKVSNFCILKFLRNI